MKKDPLFKFVPYDSRVITLLAHDLSRRVGHPIKNVFINGWNKHVLTAYGHTH